ncbi:hypothetical protein BCON_0326g00120 [Botryotinia convoluta]|uniref:Uncharacterized protein n=1 Tax=Botryotinia convoluta TaxID=54673 RepID=A0A4Z1HN30_9HELO|nr:hypothetical protein BCON_0326g00120 [Botryotinia convoluta]
MRSLLILFSVAFLLSPRVSSYFASDGWHEDGATPIYGGKYESEETPMLAQDMSGHFLVPKAYVVIAITLGGNIAKNAETAKEYAYVKQECSLGNEGVRDPITHEIKRSPEQEWTFNECVNLMFFLEQSARRLQDERRALQEKIRRRDEEILRENLKYRIESGSSPVESQPLNTARRESDDTTSGLRSV